MSAQIVTVVSQWPALHFECDKVRYAASRDVWLVNGDPSDAPAVRSAQRVAQVVCGWYSTAETGRDTGCKGAADEGAGVRS